MNELRVGFAMCGSFCTFDKVLAALEEARAEFHDVTPIMSETAFRTDSRFGRAETFSARLEEICGKRILHTLTDVEPIGPKALLDVLVVAPCTGNTLAKLASGVTDSSVTMAAKAHLRNGRPVLLAVSTNDGLSANAENIGRLLNRKNVFFVPFYQDDPAGKPNSLAADLSLLVPSVKAAAAGEQLQPLLLQKA